MSDADPAQLLANHLSSLETTSVAAIARIQFLERLVAELIHHLGTDSQGHIREWLASWAGTLNEMNARQKKDNLEEMTHQSNLAAREVLEYLNKRLPLNEVKVTPADQ